jgi:hypothetical protein
MKFGVSVTFGISISSIILVWAGVVVKNGAGAVFGAWYSRKWREAPLHHCSEALPGGSTISVVHYCPGIRGE